MLCPSEGGVDDLGAGYQKEKIPTKKVVGSGTTRHSNWGYLGSESCLMNTPPGLRDAFIQ